MEKTAKASLPWEKHYYLKYKMMDAIENQHGKLVLEVLEELHSMSAEVEDLRLSDWHMDEFRKAIRK